MSSRIYCDGCGRLIDVTAGQNYWRVTLEGDTIMSSLGEYIYPTGLRKRVGKSGTELGQHIIKGDICTGCMSRTQEGDG